MEHGALTVHKLAYTGTAAALRVLFDSSLTVCQGTGALITA